MRKVFWPVKEVFSQFTKEEQTYIHIFLQRRNYLLKLSEKHKTRRILDELAALDWMLSELADSETVED